MAGYDREKGTVDIIFQIVGGTTMELNSLQVQATASTTLWARWAAPPSEGLKKVCVVGGGVGCAIACPLPVSCTTRAARPQRRRLPQ